VPSATPFQSTWGRFRSPPMENKWYAVANYSQNGWYRIKWSKRVRDLLYRIRIGSRETNVNVEQLKLCRATREKLRSQRRERREQWGGQHSWPDMKAETSVTDSEESFSWRPERDFSQLQTETEWIPDAHHSGRQMDTADDRTQSHAEELQHEPHTAQPETSSGQQRYYLRDRARINYRNM
jgi:hypothetical protein